MKEKIVKIVNKALDEYLSDKNYKDNLPKVIIEIPRNDEFGEYSSNIGLQLAKSLKKPPKEIASALVNIILKDETDTLFYKIEVAPQGFMNFYLSDNFLQISLENAHKESSKYGHSNAGKDEKILLEYVSANPTGPLHIGHGRWAIIGDVLVRIMKASGFNVDREFYINDIGNQINMLVESVKARAKNRSVPEGGYGGAYITDIAEHFKHKTINQNNLIKYLLDKQKRTLNRLDVKFDKWFKESDLHNKNEVTAVIKEMKEKNATIFEKGALWFKSSEYGDDKDRVLVKEDFTSTYFASDIAYHVNKFKRNYDHLINIWGTDHHGYVARLRAAMGVLGFSNERLEIIIGQLVILFRGDEQIRMSKRTGEMVTLNEVIDEIGVDATRYFLVRISPNTHLDFDLELAKSRSQENPVYYVQYAHARICSMLKEAEKQEFKVEKNADLSLLNQFPERNLMIQILKLPDEIAEAALFRQPHKLSNYVEELAARFHNFYHKCRVISDDKNLTLSRLFLVDATRIVIRNVLELLGISAPKSM